MSSLDCDLYCPFAALSVLSLRIPISSSPRVAFPSKSLPGAKSFFTVAKREMRGMFHSFW
jgi:hypothetical protein